MESKSKMLMTAGAVSFMVLAAGCASWQNPGGGNMTSYTTGSYKMPTKTTTTTAANTTTPAQVRANGDATAHDSRVRTEAPVNQGTVVAAQQALAKAGYNPGSADGSMGPSTHQALSEFQRARGLRQTGELDPQTLSALGVPQQ